MKRLIFDLTMGLSRKHLKDRYGRERYREFRSRSKSLFRDVLPRIPDIGPSIFSFNYQFAPSYIAWYKAFSEMGIPPEEIDRNLWSMNERMTGIIPRFLLHAVGKAYFSSFRKKSAAHIRRQETGKIHPYDWKIAYRGMDAESFEIDILSCPFQRLSREFGVPGLLPGICRMDYLFAHLMKNGFTRSKTLGDGNDCCDCRYFLHGDCEWSPEKGFLTRK